MPLQKPVLKFILVTISISAGIAVYFLPAIHQDQSYHQFADQRTLLGIPNYWNVISNLLFLWIGINGLQKIYQKRLHIIAEVNTAYLIFFSSITLIAFGSAYYHLQPNNLTLVWDRLPMTLAFMSLLSFALAEFLSPAWAAKSLFPLLLTGMASVCYWYIGELHGAGDLRLYALVQFLPLLLLLLLLVFGQPVFKNCSGYWYLFAAYALAKVAEHFDTVIYNRTAGIIAGHAIKHLLSAAGLYILIIFFEKRNYKAGEK